MKKILFVALCLFFACTLHAFDPSPDTKYFSFGNKAFVVAADIEGLCLKNAFTDSRALLLNAEREFKNKKRKAWSLDFEYRFRLLEACAAAVPPFIEASKDSETFLITVNGQRQRFKMGYWVNALGIVFHPYLELDGYVYPYVPKLCFFYYFELENALQDGDVLCVSHKGKTLSHSVYDEHKTQSYAIKIAQEGYAQDAVKVAYLGAWRGTLEPLDVSAFEGKEVNLLRVSDSVCVFQTRWRKREGHLFHSVDTLMNHPITGEMTLDCDFFVCQTPGDYVLYTPGIGVSYPFRIGTDAYGVPFYIHMRGLFHQRGSCAKTMPYTAWELPKEKMPVYTGGFSPDIGDYSEKSGMYRLNGKPVMRSPFSVVERTATKQARPEVFGGYWDAGDYDRRPMHFRIVDDLLTALILNPEALTDSQLNIPESGNGIPDVLDEALWGIDIWYRAQNKNGSVGCWMEATSHPKTSNPGEDEQPYYLALPTRHSSLEYASMAAKTAHVCHRLGYENLAAKYTQSAIRAFNFALVPSNRAQTSFSYGDKTYTYLETDKMPDGLFFKAAYNLYAVTSDSRYAPYLTPEYFSAAQKHFLRIGEYATLSELFYEIPGYFMYTQRYKTSLMRYVKDLQRIQNQAVYRNPTSHAPNHPYYLNLGWGMGLPSRYGMIFAMVARLEANANLEKKASAFSARDAADFAAAFMCGANPMGRTYTTGIGKNAPVNLLSHPCFYLRIKFAEPIPGITLYTFTGQVEHKAFESMYALDVGKRPDHGFWGMKITLVDTKKSPFPAGTSQRQRMYNYLPVFHRFANLEAFAVAQCEFTVWETIAPSAAMYALLLEKGWMPSDTLLNRKPIKNKHDIEGYIFLP